MAEPRDPTQDSADYRLWLRIKYAASAAGYSGVREMSEAMHIEGLSYGSLLRLSRDYETLATSHEFIAQAVSDHCRERGANVPAAWLLSGFNRDT